MIDISSESIQIITASVVAKASVEIATVVRPHALNLASEAVAGTDRVTITGPGVTDEYGGRPWIIAAVSGA